jgi:predicted PurR-regulated permease PerM
MAEFAPGSAARRRVAPAGTPSAGLGVVQAGLLTVAVLYFGQDLFVPLALAVLLSFILAPVARALRRLRLGRVAGVLISVTLAFALISGLGLLIGRQVTSLAGNLPFYQATVAERLESLRFSTGLLGRLSGLVRDLERETQPPAERAPAAAPPSPPPETARPATETEPRPIPVEIRRAPPTALETVRTVFAPLVEPLATTGIVVVLVIFILLYREDLRDRLIRLAGARDLHRTVAAMDDAAYRLSRFFLAQAALNASFGVFIAAALWLIGVPNAVLWGIIAGLMRFVPFVGSFVAVVGPLVLAVAVDPGWTMPLLVATLFLVGELSMGQVFEPLIFGHSTGLSPIAVIAAATFWTWLWGPIGLLLAVPLTVCLVVLGRHVEQLEFLEVMLGVRPPLQPEETFYQRALAGDGDALVEQAEQHLRDASLSRYYDEVALPGLALAQADWSRAALDGDRMEAFRRQVETLLDDVEDEEDESPPEPLVERPDKPPDETAEEDRSATEEDMPPPGWREPGAVVCIAGRGRLDDLASAMLAQVLQKRGFGVQAEPNATLRAANLDRLDPERVRLCCLSVLEGGSSPASTRYFLRRIRRRLPDAAIVIGLWQAPPDSAALAELRVERGEDQVVTSIRDAVLTCQAAARRTVPGSSAATDQQLGAALSEPHRAA